MPLPDTMAVIEISEPGGPDVLVTGERPVTYTHLTLPTSDQV